MYDHPIEGRRGIDDIALKLICMSMNTVKWSCLYSGAGIPLTQGEEYSLNGLLNIEHVNPSDNIFQKPVPLKCIYKKSKPGLVNANSVETGCTNYTWDPKSFDRVITSSSQANMILALCTWAELLINEDLMLGSLLVKNAEIFYDFLSTYLRNEDGLFISVEDKTKSPDKDVKTKPCQKDSKLRDQLCVFEALMCLHHTTSRSEIKEYFNPQNSKYIVEARSLFNYINENYHDFLEMSSKQISLSISILARCCKYETDGEQLVSFNQLIALLCAELESRINVAGILERGYNNSAPASFITHFRAASALLEGSAETGIKKFSCLSERTFEYLIDLFDYSMGLFITGDSTELSYSIRDIAEIIKGLYLYCSSYKKERSQKVLLDFFTSSIEKSRIMPSVESRYFKYGNREVQIPDEIPLFFECSVPPVFLKSFRFIFKKNRYYTLSKYFNSSYSLYSSYLFMNYLSPVLENK